jgi:hypothetical protein
MAGLSTVLNPALNGLNIIGRIMPEQQAIYLRLHSKLAIPLIVIVTHHFSFVSAAAHSRGGGELSNMLPRAQTGEGKKYVCTRPRRLNLN